MNSRGQRTRNHRDEIAEVTNLDRYFKEPFENNDQELKNNTIIRFKELLRENELTGGALSDFSNHAPWRAQFNGFLKSLENQWERMLFNPSERNEFSSDFLAGGLKIIKTIEKKIMQDDFRSQEYDTAKQAEMEARNSENLTK